MDENIVICQFGGGESIDIFGLVFASLLAKCLALKNESLLVPMYPFSEQERDISSS